MVAGTGGLSLATVIRLEFAYPGVGVLAGDSLQYLSIATSHGVIMVFYMIMPAIFGAFGNFLLPTQLGVHDVAFPRLNSAAFWFLPGGVIMLFQLVCTDRRYARMNCFNIRELQSILKDKFFEDLVGTHDHRSLLSSTMLNLRYKTDLENNSDLEITNFYNFGLLNSNLNKLESTYSYGGSFTTKRSRVVLSDMDYRFLTTNLFNTGNYILRSVIYSCYFFNLKEFFSFFFLLIPSLPSLSTPSFIRSFWEKVPSL